MDGPVVKAAQQALASGDVHLVLIWVRRDNEKEIQAAFVRTLAVRKLGAEAEELADMYFFEMLVRVHRVGEGAPYTGVRPAGRDLGPAIPLADQALATGEVESPVDLVTEATRRGLPERFAQAMKALKTSTASVEAGREYVRAYEVFIHYAERAHEAASQPATGQLDEPPHAAGGHEKGAER
ncbi:MAG TPA: DUF6448 family protein [Planctomycetota bacterium]|nr:DUF6448 family protein [Planctomycetota bacterium]